MLTLTRTRTDDITESDLIPGSKWRRKSDGAKCVLIADESPFGEWCMISSHRCVRFDGRSNFNAPKMLDLLRRDFERVGERHPTMKLADLCSDNAFKFRGRVWLIAKIRVRTATCVAVNGSQTMEIYLSDVVEDLGPITIDPSVTGGGE